MVSFVQFRLEVTELECTEKTTADHSLCDGDTAIFDKITGL